ncbi:uncharacterized protein LOC129567920 isoform X2 [Sitodiplosis mosellana]|uniref:uncharacterized protein LOC129567920 isoform X2 n=1 Tax=Sitodiplosis mosellana TaxID=263140 RepID=UPI002444EAAB|nr:uncharacterized protein LOC129567920 isoform X2 [Sitodiplosis mosellana]
METSEQPPNDDVTARREARRRRILENSKSRLTRITGREHTDEDDKKKDDESKTQPTEPMIYPDPEIERDVYIPQSAPPFPPELFADVNGMGGSFDDQKQFFELLNTLQQQSGGSTGAGASNFAAFAQFGNADGGGPNPFFANLTTNESPKVPETRLQKFLNTKIHIGLLAILTYLFILYTPFHWNVFLVFLVWEIAEIFILGQHETNPNGIINVLFMLAGISPAKVNIALKWIQLLNKVLRDVALFMFFFVLSHLCRASWNGFSLVPLVENSDQSTGILDKIDDSADDVFEHFDL